MDLSQRFPAPEADMSKLYERMGYLMEGNTHFVYTHSRRGLHEREAPEAPDELIPLSSVGNKQTAILQSNSAILSFNEIQKGLLHLQQVYAQIIQSFSATSYKWFLSECCALLQF